MRTAELFIIGKEQAVRLPKDMQFEDVALVEITREGDSIILKPIRKTWKSFADVPKADENFLAERPDIIEEGRVKT